MISRRSNPQDRVDTSGLPDEFVSFVNGIEGIIRDVDLWILSFQRSLGNTIKKVIDGNGTLMDYVNITAVIGLGVLVAGIAVSAASWAQIARGVIGSIRTAIATFLKIVRFDLIIAFHRTLMYLWPQYNALFQGVYNAAGGVSQSLGMAVEFLPTLLMNAQTVVVSAATLAGVHPDRARIDFLSDAADWIADMDVQWRAYAKNPGAILRDLQAEIIRSSEIYGETAYGALNDTINGLTDTVTSTADNLFTLEGDLNTLIENLPPDIFESVQDRWGVIHDEIVAWRDEHYEPTIEMLQGALIPLSELAASNEAKIESMVKKGDPSSRTLIQWLYDRFFSGVGPDGEKIPLSELDQPSGDDYTQEKLAKNPGKVINQVIDSMSADTAIPDDQLLDYEVMGIGEPFYAVASVVTPFEYPEPGETDPSILEIIAEGDVTE